MTSIPAAHAPQPGHAETTESYLTYPRGVRSWLFTVDHKRIGVMYLGMILIAFLLGGIFAMLIRTELWSPGPTILGSEATFRQTYNEVFTLHGAIMIFMFIIPGIPGALGNFVLPLMLGARDVAFPKLNLASLWLYAIGSVLFILSLTGTLTGRGAVDTGWTFYTPYSTTTPTMVIPVLFGALVLGFSSIFTGINFVASMHMLRPPTMTWFKMPLMLWALYATAIIQILATPVLAITLILLIFDRWLGGAMFDPTHGGDPVLFQHFFWFYSHPAVYIMILPAMGIISETISIFSRKHIFGYRMIAMSSVAIAALSFLVWGHHMFVSGQSNVGSAIFSFMTFFVAIPSAVKAFNWTATLYKGSIVLKAPMLWTLGFLAMFAWGGLTGLFLGTLAVDIHVTDTYFVVAHFHYVMMGGAVFAFLAGLHHWWPKMFGRMYPERPAAWAWLIIFVGFNVTFFIQFVMGTQGMPRRTADYGRVATTGVDLSRFEGYHRISTVGSYMLLAGFGLMAGYLTWSLVRGPKAPANPWGGNTLEWKTSSPPPEHNFDATPVVGDPYDFTNLVWDEKTGGYVEKEPPAAVELS